MTTSKNIRIAVVGVLAVAVAAAGAAAGASKLRGGGHAAAPTLASGSFVTASSASTQKLGRHGPGGRHRDELAAAATYLGISEDALRTQLEAGKTLAQVAGATSGKSVSGLVDALVAAEQKEIAAAVTAGRLTQAEADTILKGLKARVTEHVDRTGPPAGRDGHGGGPFGHHGGGLDAAATYLGVTESALITQLRSGKTLAQVAAATAGKSRAGLIAALVAAEKAELAQAVKDGHLTQAQADGISATLEARVTDMVDHAPPARPDRTPPGAPQPSGTSSGTHI
jgi:hypothetical protein